jgi:hypothetical protein
VQKSTERVPSSSPTVLLYSTVSWPSTCRLSAVFATLSWRVVGLVPSGHLLCCSQFPGRLHTYSSLSPARSLKQAIAASNPDLVVPCDDRALACLLSLADVDVVNLSLGNPFAYRELTSRSPSISMARQLGVRAPETIEVGSACELDRCLDSLELPAVLKADGSWGGVGVAVVRTRSQAHDEFHRMKRSGGRLREAYRFLRYRDGHHLRSAFDGRDRVISLQTFVPGTQATSTIACWQGRVIAELHFDVVAAHERMGPACVLRRIESAEMSLAAHRIAGHFMLSGLHGLDFICDARGQRHLIEINARAPQTSYLSFGPGRDPVAALAKQVSGSTTEQTAIDDDLVALFPQEWKRDPNSHYLTEAYLDGPWDDPAVLRACVSV